MISTFRHSVSRLVPLVDSGVIAILAWLSFLPAGDPSWYLDIKDRLKPERGFVSRPAW